METPTPSGYFSGLSLITSIFGVGFLIVCLILWSFLRQNALLLFGAAMLFGGFENSLACLVLHRMERSGHEVGFWRGPKDFKLYWEYWRTAPQKNWSRLLLAGALVCGLVAGIFLFSTLFVAAGNSQNEKTHDCLKHPKPVRGKRSLGS
jgi:hypothetical protein